VPTRLLKKPMRLASFEEIFLPHLDAAYNLARWLTRNNRDGEDLAQEAYVRAWNAFDDFHGGDAQVYLLRIVRKTCDAWSPQDRFGQLTPLDEDIQRTPGQPSIPDTMPSPSLDGRLLQQALRELPPPLREVMVLRETEGLSYRKIAAVCEIPIGNVMSRLARARHWIQSFLAESMEPTVASVEDHG